MTVNLISILIVLLGSSSYIVVHSHPHHAERCCDDDSKAESSMSSNSEPIDNDDSEILNSWQDYDDCDDATNEDISCKSAPSSASSSSSSVEKPADVVTSTETSVYPEQPSDLLAYRSEVRGFICLQIDVGTVDSQQPTPQSDHQRSNQHDYLVCTDYIKQLVSLYTMRVRSIIVTYE